MWIGYQDSSGEKCLNPVTKKERLLESGFEELLKFFGFSHFSISY
jgi:hypothetical protein